MTQPEEQHQGQQPADDATAPAGSTPAATGADSEPTARVEPTSPAAPSVWDRPSAEPAAPQSPAAPPGWGQPSTDPTAAQPAAPPAWGQPSAGPAAPSSPGQPGQPAQSGVPLPPGWGQSAQPGQSGEQGQPGQPAYQPPVDPFHTTTMTPTSAQLPYNPYAPAGDGQQLPPGMTPEQMQLLQPPPKKKSKALLITSIVLGVVLLLCAGGGVAAYLLINNSEGKGAESAKDAAQEFLTAVYKDHDAEAAEKLVCNEARDRDAINNKIKEIEDQQAKLKSPSITWDSPKIENETAQQADTTVTVKLTTSDEKYADQTLKLTLVKHDGWFVCEVQEQKK